MTVRDRTDKNKGNDPSVLDTAQKPGVQCEVTVRKERKLRCGVRDVGLTHVTQELKTSVRSGINAPRQEHKNAAKSLILDGLFLK